MKSYYTIVIPFVPRWMATKWHPTEPTGPMSTLTRGMFSNLSETVQWARNNLCGLPYSVREVEGE